MTVVPLRPDPSTVPATMTDYQRMMASAMAPETVGCSFCDAARGFPCQSSGGYTVPFHAARQKAVAHLTDDERVAAFAALQAERRRIRDAWEDQHRRNLADPQWVAQRDATRKWWNDRFDEIDEAVRAEEHDFRSRCTDTPFRGSRTHADGCRCLHTGEVEFTPEFARARRERERHEALRGTLPVTDLATVRGAR